MFLAFIISSRKNVFSFYVEVGTAFCHHTTSMTALLETIMIFKILATATEFKFTATSFLIEHPLLGASTKYEILVTVVELNLQIFKYCVRCLHAFKVNFTLQKNETWLCFKCI